MVREVEVYLYTRNGMVMAVVMVNTLQYLGSFCTQMVTLKLHRFLFFSMIQYSCLDHTQNYTRKSNFNADLKITEKY